MTKTTIDNQAAKAKRLNYRTPEALEIERSAQLVQGGGGGAGFDWWNQYFPDANGE
jgi:hypothetical protein